MCRRTPPCNTGGSEMWDAFKLMNEWERTNKQISASSPHIFVVIHYKLPKYINPNVQFSAESFGGKCVEKLFRSFLVNVALSFQTSVVLLELEWVPRSPWSPEKHFPPSRSFLSLFCFHGKGRDDSAHSRRLNCSTIRKTQPGKRFSYVNTQISFKPGLQQRPAFIQSRSSFVKTWSFKGNVTPDGRAAYVLTRPLDEASVSVRASGPVAPSVTVSYRLVPETLQIPSRPVTFYGYTQ